MALSDEKILSNWQMFRKLCEGLGDRSSSVLAMLDHFEDRAPLAPASSRKSFHAAYPGGLIDHSLRVLGNSMKLTKAYGYDLSKESLIISCLFHDWGKVGDLDADLYLPQDSDWHREKLGEMYKTNEKIQWMPNAQRGLWLMQHFGIKLKQDEWLAIFLNDGPVDDANRKYCMKEPLLAIIVHQADRMAAQMEKDAEG